MSQQLSVLRRHLLGAVGKRADDQVLNIKTNDIINRAISEILAVATWYFMSKTATITLVNGTKEYSLAADLDKILDTEVRLGTSFGRVYFVNDREFDQVVTSPTAQGNAPEHFTLRGYQLIQLYPIPNATAVTNEGTIDYEYFRTYTLLSSDSDTSPLPDKYDLGLMMHRAQELLHIHFRDINQAGGCERKFKDALEMAMEDNRKIVEAGLRDIIRTSPTDQRQSTGTDQRRRR